MAGTQEPAEEGHPSAGSCVLKTGAMAEAWLGLADRIQRPVPEPDAGSLHPALRAKFGWVS